MCLDSWSGWSSLPLISVSCKSGEPWTLPKPEAMAMFLWKAGIQAGSFHAWGFGNINMHCMQWRCSSSHAFCLFMSECVCVSIGYATSSVMYCYVLRLFGSWQGKSKVKKWMQCIAMQLKCNAIWNAKQCAYVDRYVRTSVSIPISKPRSLVNMCSK